MSIKDRIEDGFGRVNSAVFRRVNDRTEWWHLPVPLGLLNLRALRDDLRQSNLYDTEAEAAENERIEVVEVPLARLDSVIRDCRDSKTLVGLLWLRAFLNR